MSEEVGEAQFGSQGDYMGVGPRHDEAMGPVQGEHAGSRFTGAL